VTDPSRSSADEFLPLLHEATLAKLQRLRDNRRGLSIVELGELTGAWSSPERWWDSKSSCGLCSVATADGRPSNTVTFRPMRDASSLLCRDNEMLSTHGEALFVVKLGSTHGRAYGSLEEACALGPVIAETSTEPGHLEWWKRWVDNKDARRLTRDDAERLAKQRAAYDQKLKTGDRSRLR
jgi:hypothetical protein